MLKKIAYKLINVFLSIINYRVIDKNEWTVEYKIFSGNVFRQKTYNKQNLSSYVHKKHWQLCPYFSQAYFLIASDEDSEFVFQEFTKRPNVQIRKETTISFFSSDTDV